MSSLRQDTVRFSGLITSYTSLPTRQVWRVEDPSTGAEEGIDLPQRGYILLGTEKGRGRMTEACSVLCVCMCTHLIEKGEGAETGGLARDPA